jgi:MscS family membrane protein
MPNQTKVDRLCRPVLRSNNVSKVVAHSLGVSCQKPQVEFFAKSCLASIQPRVEITRSRTDGNSLERALAPSFLSALSDWFCHFWQYYEVLLRFTVFSMAGICASLPVQYPLVWRSSFVCKQVFGTPMRTSTYTARRLAKAVFCLALLFAEGIWAQADNLKGTPDAGQPESPKDTIGRNTPKGTVLGFITAARKGNAEIAALYLNTPLRGGDAAALARQLGVVLDRRLPARLNQISDKPEGSIPDPLRPDEDVVGTIKTQNGDLDIVVERVDRGKAGKVWLFSRKTLASIPAVFQELSTPTLEEFLPEFLVKTTVAHIPLFEWLALFVGMPVLYLLTGLLNRVLARGVGALRRRLGRDAARKNPQILRVPIRLMLVALIIRFLLMGVTLPLLARQFWSTTALLIAVTASLWWLLLLTGWTERYLLRHRPRLSGSASVLRLFRRLIDGILLFAGLLFMLYHFGIKVTGALAGLGVGGIAVALAAQKTLENVIAGVSLIADEAVRVGDFMTLGDVQGTVEEVGLRSTRIRTLDRTLVSLPNGQIANMKLETLSVRDKFWFHPVIGLRYETTPGQLRSILNSLREFLNQHPYIDPASVRVRFIRFGASSLDVDVFAYASAADWATFLEIQEELLFAIIDIVQKAGAAIAFPSQTLYLGDMSQRLSHQLVNVSKQTEAERVA